MGGCRPPRKASLPRCVRLARAGGDDHVPALLVGEQNRVLVRLEDKILHALHLSCNPAHCNAPCCVRASAGRPRSLPGPCMHSEPDNSRLKAIDTWGIFATSRRHSTPSSVMVSSSYLVGEEARVRRSQPSKLVAVSGDSLAGEGRQFKMLGAPKARLAFLNSLGLGGSHLWRRCVERATCRLPQPPPSLPRCQFSNGKKG